MDAPNNVTQLLVAWSGGDQAALDALTPLVHQELHRLAARYMAGERPGHLLQPTALVNEAYVRLVRGVARPRIAPVVVRAAPDRRAERRGSDWTAR